RGGARAGQRAFRAGRRAGLEKSAGRPRGHLPPPDGERFGRPPMRRESFSWSRWVGIIVKEFIQLKRDRLTFGMIIGLPVLQLILFGYAINSDPKRLPTAVLAADSSPYARSLLAAMQTSGYFRLERFVQN